MRLHVFTPRAESLRDLEVSAVTIPGELGEMQILPGHTQLLSLVQAGELHYAGPAGAGQLQIGAGHVEVDADVITLAVDAAE